MDSFQNPVGPPDPFDSFRVESSTERQNKDSDTGNTPPKKDKGGLLTYLIESLQRAFARFLDRYSSSNTREIEFVKNLKLLKSFFEILKLEDRSQDVTFLNNLSKSWNQAIQDSAEFEEAARLSFKLFIKKVLTYPENQTHTLGYYLTEYAGQKWVPFPYMELVAKIHSDYEKNPILSPLDEWIVLLEQTLQPLKKI